MSGRVQALAAVNLHHPHLTRVEGDGEWQGHLTHCSLLTKEMAKRRRKKEHQGKKRTSRKTKIFLPLHTHTHREKKNERRVKRVQHYHSAHPVTATAIYETEEGEEKKRTVTHLTLATVTHLSQGHQ